MRGLKMSGKYTRWKLIEYYGYPPEGIPVKTSRRKSSRGRDHIVAVWKDKRWPYIGSDTPLPVKYRPLKWKRIEGMTSSIIHRWNRFK